LPTTYFLKYFTVDFHNNDMSTKQDYSSCTDLFNATCSNLYHFQIDGVSKFMHIYFSF
jgi:hypothetical protein